MPLSSVPIIDISNNHLGLTAGDNVYVDLSTFKYGLGSVYFSGSANSDIKFDSNSKFGFSTGDFSIEMWIKPQSSSLSYTSLFSIGSASNGILMRLNSLSADNLYIAGSSYDWGAGRIKNNTWSHIVLSRELSVIKTFINGTITLSAFNGSNLGLSKDLIIGNSKSNPVEYYKGYMDDIHIINGATYYPINNLSANKIGNNVVWYTNGVKSTPAQAALQASLSGVGNGTIGEFGLFYTAGSAATPEQAVQYISFTGTGDGIVGLSGVIYNSGNLYSGQGTSNLGVSGIWYTDGLQSTPSQAATQSNFTGKGNGIVGDNNVWYTDGSPSGAEQSAIQANFTGLGDGNVGLNGSWYTNGSLSTPSQAALQSFFSGIGDGTIGESGTWYNNGYLSTTEEAAAQQIALDSAYTGKGDGTTGILNEWYTNGYHSTPAQAADQRAAESNLTGYGNGTIGRNGVYYINGALPDANDIAGLLNFTGLGNGFIGNAGTWYTNGSQSTPTQAAIQASFTGQGDGTIGVSGTWYSNGSISTPAQAAAQSNLTGQGDGIIGVSGKWYTSGALSTPTQAAAQSNFTGKGNGVIGVFNVWYTRGDLSNPAQAAAQSANFTGLGNGTIGTADVWYTNGSESTPHQIALQTNFTGKGNGTIGTNNIWYNNGALFTGKGNGTIGINNVWYTNGIRSTADEAAVQTNFTGLGDGDIGRSYVYYSNGQPSTPHQAAVQTNFSGKGNGIIGNDNVWYMAGHYANAAEIAVLESNFTGQGDGTMGVSLVWYTNGKQSTPDQIAGQTNFTGKGNDIVGIKDIWYTNGQHSTPAQIASQTNFTGKGNDIVGNNNVWYYQGSEATSSQVASIINYTGLGNGLSGLSGTWYSNGYASTPTFAAYQANLTGLGNGSVGLSGISYTNGLVTSPTDMADIRALNASLTGYGNGYTGKSGIYYISGVKPSPDTYAFHSYLTGFGDGIIGEKYVAYKYGSKLLNTVYRYYDSYNPQPFLSYVDSVALKFNYTGHATHDDITNYVGVGPTTKVNSVIQYYAWGDGIHFGWYNIPMILSGRDSDFYLNGKRPLDQITKYASKFTGWDGSKQLYYKDGLPYTGIYVHPDMPSSEVLELLLYKIYNRDQKILVNNFVTDYNSPIYDGDGNIVDYNVVNQPMCQVDSSIGLDDTIFRVEMFYQFVSSFVGVFQEPETGLAYIYANYQLIPFSVPPPDCYGNDYDGVPCCSEWNDLDELIYDEHGTGGWTLDNYIRSNGIGTFYTGFKIPDVYIVNGKPIGLEPIATNYGNIYTDYLSSIDTIPSIISNPSNLATGIYNFNNVTGNLLLSSSPTISGCYYSGYISNQPLSSKLFNSDFTLKYSNQNTIAYISSIPCLQLNDTIPSRIFNDCYFVGTDGYLVEQLNDININFDRTELINHFLTQWHSTALIDTPELFNNIMLTNNISGYDGNYILQQLSMASNELNGRFNSISDIYSYKDYIIQTYQNPNIISNSYKDYVLSNIGQFERAMYQTVPGLISLSAASGWYTNGILSTSAQSAAQSSNFTGLGNGIVGLSGMFYKNGKEYLDIPNIDNFTGYVSSYNVWYTNGNISTPDQVASQCNYTGLGNSITGTMFTYYLTGNKFTGLGNTARTGLQSTWNISQKVGVSGIWYTNGIESTPNQAALQAKLNGYGNGYTGLNNYVYLSGNLYTGLGYEPIGATGYYYTSGALSTPSQAAIQANYTGLGNGISGLSNVFYTSGYPSSGANLNLQLNNKAKEVKYNGWGDGSLYGMNDYYYNNGDISSASVSAMSLKYTGVGNGIVGESKYFYISGYHYPPALGAFYYAQYICMEYGKTHNNTLWADPNSPNGYFEGDGYIGLSGVGYFIYWYTYDLPISYTPPQNNNITLNSGSYYFYTLKDNLTLFNGKISSGNILWSLPRNYGSLIPSTFNLSLNTGYYRYKPENQSNRFSIDLLCVEYNTNDIFTPTVSPQTQNEFAHYPHTLGNMGFIDSYYNGYDDFVLSQE